ncbi:MAG: hypothetical protein J7515_16460 [Caulobacter sp.]|nr:hypothetical protein [Caulobacter sp.]
MDQAAGDLLHQCSALIDAAGGGKDAPWWPKEMFTAALSALFGLGAAWIAIAFDRRKTINQELIKKRIEVFDKMAPKLNDLLCFARCVGDWRNLSPGLMLKHKRDLDRDFAIYRALFSGALAQAYFNLIEGQYFAAWQGSGQDARLRVLPARLMSEWGAAWDPAWSGLFSAAQDARRPEQIAQAYVALMNQFAVEIGARPAPSRLFRRRASGA